VAVEWRFACLLRVGAVVTAAFRFVLVCNLRSQLSLHYNLLSDEVPLSVASLPGLLVLHLENNCLIPPSPATLSALAHPPPDGYDSASGVTFAVQRKWVGWGGVLVA
jgi:hypothetical protein